MTKFRHHNTFRYATIALGVGIPLILLAVSLPISGVSYRLGNVCVPNKKSALVTWFFWILLFAAVSWVIQVVTILYCLWRYASSTLAGPTGKSSATRTTASTSSEATKTGQPPLTPNQNARQSWRKVKRVLLLQWRSILLCFLIMNLCVFFGMAYIQQNITTHVIPGTQHVATVDLAWLVCLMLNEGDKSKCHLSEASGLGLVEPRAIATLSLGTVSLSFPHQN